jgi:hypothetical protein
MGATAIIFYVWMVALVTSNRNYFFMAGSGCYISNPNYFYITAA